jgi:hypothetical protein
MVASDRDCVWTIRRSGASRWTIAIRKALNRADDDLTVGWGRSDSEARMLTESIRTAGTLDPAKSTRSFLPVTDAYGVTRSGLLPVLIEASDVDGRGIDLASRTDGSPSPLFRMAIPSPVVDEAHVQSVIHHHAMLLAGHLKAANGLGRPLTRWL